MGELIVPVLMLFMGGAFLFESGRLKIKEGYALTSASYPRLLAIILILCAVVLIIRFFLKYKYFITEEKTKGLDLRIFAVFAILLLFYLLLEPLGYLICGVLLMSGLSLLLQKGKRHMFDSILFPVVLTVGLFIVFQFMNVYLPAGILFKGIP